MSKLLAVLAASSTLAFAAGTCQSQAITMIGIDPVNNIGYVPIFQPDASNNSQLALVNLAPGANPAVMQTISLPGSGATYGITYNPNNQTMLIAAVLAGSVSVIVYVIDTNTRTIEPGSPIFTNVGINGVTPGGGIVMDVANNRAIVAGSGPIGFLDASTTPNTWHSVTTSNTTNNVAMAFNQSTGLLFVSGGTGGVLVDTTKTPPWTGTYFSPAGFVTTLSLGAAFDPSTNMMILTPSGYHDITEGVNFNTYTAPSGSAATADFTVIDGLGEMGPYPIEGYGPGGWAAVNCATHQAVVADLDGENIKLIQLPTAAIAGMPDNNGQPYTGTTADASSAYTIADTLVSKTACGNPLYIRDNKSGSPAIAIDPQHNLLYAKADTGGVNAPQYLVRTDLSAPVLGGCPPNATHNTGDTGAPCTLGAWNPVQSAILLPGNSDCTGFTLYLGNNQGAALGATFGRSMEVQVLTSTGAAAGGAIVTFTAPSTGPSGTFAGGSLTATATANAQGLATAPAFTANNTPGGYLVMATTPTYTTPVDFNMTNYGNSVNVTFQTSPPGLLLSIDEGTFVAAPVTQAMTVGSIHSVNTRSPQTVTGTQYVWQSWSDGQPQSHNIVVTGPVTLTATFTTQYTLTITASPAAGGTVTPASGTLYNAGTVVPITATSNQGYAFTGWTGAVASASSASTTVTMTGPLTVTANFTAGQVPGTPAILSPNQGATGVSTTASLTWGAATGATSYNVYLGTSNPPSLVTNTAGTSYSPTMTPGTTYYWSVTAVNAYGTTASSLYYFTTGTQTTSGYRFVPVTPCRIMDTRGATGTFGGPSIAGGATRSVPIPQSSCNIPSTAQAYSLNITVVPPGALTYLTIWPTGQSQPVVSTLNSLDGRIVANAAIVPAGTNGAISVFVSNATDVIIDINGYFAPASTSGSMSFYAATPCRIVDTRGATGAFGGPFMSAGSTRSFVVPSSSCNVPATAQAYSLNITVVPHGTLSYLTTWPTGQSQPLVSTLNSINGSIVANAAIVPAGTSGAVSVFVTNDTDVIIDINGYFAPAGSTGALSLYTLTPCRIVDTRGATGTFGGPTLPANGTRSFPVPQSSCSVPSTAQAYSLNVTVVPPGQLIYLTAWPTGQTQPVVSTLNSPLGAVVANAAIVPAGSTGPGAVSIFVSDATNVILDINAYFAQ